MNKFLKSLEKELNKLKIGKNDIEEILNDHKEMIESAISEGLDTQKIEEKFGNPIVIAKNILEDTLNYKETEKKEQIKFNDVDSCVKAKTDNYDFVNSFQVISGEISIDVNLVNENLSITTYDGESIQIYQKGIKNIGDYIILLTEDIFIVKKEKTVIKLFNFSKDKDSRFLILIPNHIAVKEFSYKTVSGDTNINGITSNGLKIKSTSGDAELTNIVADDVKISTVSGDIEIGKTRAKSFEVSSISGNIEIEKGLIDGMMYFHSVSGDIELFEVECTEASLKTVSGDLTGKEFYPSEVSLKSVSGDINIKNSDDSKEIIVKSKKTISGDINIK
ncbi:MAG: DUF4097 family beta strand repeat protein [Candidatus Izimaplasma sp.]|nr:DUF4097 family beta strand repeat protein [Candidatus Izimaplasma bacterium]